MNPVEKPHQHPQNHLHHGAFLTFLRTCKNYKKDKSDHAYSQGYFYTPTAYLSLSTAEEEFRENMTMLREGFTSPDDFLSLSEQEICKIYEMDKIDNYYFSQIEAFNSQNYIQKVKKKLDYLCKKYDICIIEVDSTSMAYEIYSSSALKNINLILLHHETGEEITKKDMAMFHRANWIRGGILDDYCNE